MPRPVAKIIFWLHRHTHRNITFMYWTILSTRVTKLEEHLCWNSRCLSHMLFLLLRRNYWHYCLAFSHKDDLIYHVCPSKKCTSHSDVYFFLTPSVHFPCTPFGTYSFYQLHLQRNCPQAKRNECEWKHKGWMHVVLNRSLALPLKKFFF